MFLPFSFFKGVTIKESSFKDFKNINLIIQIVSSLLAFLVYVRKNSSDNPNLESIKKYQALAWICR